MVKLCEQNLTDPKPSGWVVALFHSGPPVSERLAKIASWERVSAGLLARFAYFLDVGDNPLPDVGMCE